MKKPVTVKLLAKSGISVHDAAKRLGNRCSSSNLPSGYQVKDGYIIKAQRNLKGYNVLVVDTPMYLMLTGNTRTNTTTPNPSVPVGARDEFSPSEEPSTATYEAFENDANFYVPHAQPKDPIEAPFQELIWAPVQWRGSTFGLGTKRFPYKAGGGWNVAYDNAERFPYSQTATLTCKMADFLTCALPADTVNQLQSTYLGLAHFNVSEDDLPAGWSHWPRRLVSGETYTDGGDFYRLDRTASAMWQFGVAWAPAGEIEPEVDYFCMTSEIYRQVRDTWLKYGPEEGHTYNPPYYDREGEHALGVFIGKLSRETYDPDQAAEPLYAEMIDQYMVKAVDMPVPDLRPYPADVARLSGGPSRPNFAYFIDPLVLRSTEGFTAFCVYRHDRRRPINSLYLRALLVVTPDATPHVIKADAYPNNQGYDYDTAELVDLDLPGYSDAVKCNPWLVGGFTVDGVTPDDVPTQTAYALVYEHDDSLTAETWQETPVFGVVIGSNIGDSKWALYTVESGPPTRTELTQVTPCASPVASLMTSGIWPLLQSSDSNNMWAPFNILFTRQQRQCNFAFAGNGMGVTASIDRPHDMTPMSGGWGGENDLVPHPVKCAVVNLLDGTIEQRGTIFVRDRMWTWCFITVAQPYDPGDPDNGVPETPPTLVASSVDTTSLPFPSGKSWLSVDGGWTWSEYVTDVGAHMGAHLVGNQLFEYDPLKPFL